MLGYWDDPEKTAEAIDADGWMHTGDLAVMREDGYCNIVGRIKDMVIRGGENIYPREIEEFLYTHPDIEDVQVIGVPDEKYGEELCAWVKMKSGAEPLDADAVREFATGKLAHYKIPRYVMVVDEFPMTVTGKIRKVEMREESAAELGLATLTRRQLATGQRQRVRTTGIRARVPVAEVQVSQPSSSGAARPAPPTTTRNRAVSPGRRRTVAGRTVAACSDAAR